MAFIEDMGGYFRGRITILDRYLFREFSGPFVLAVGGFAVIAIVDILFYLVELFVISGISFFTIIRLLVYKLPSLMIIFFPMAVLFAVMLLLVRMAKDNEITVLRASGVPSFRILLPVLIFAFGATLISFWTNEKLVPWANHSADVILHKEIKKKPPPIVAENIVFKDVGDRFFYIKKIDKKQGLMKHVLIFESTGGYPRVTLAKEALWNKKSWSLLKGQIIEFGTTGLVEFSDQFSELIIHVSQDIESFFSHRKKPSEMDSSELREKIQVLNKGGVSTRAYRVEYHMKKSVPAACFVFGIMGIAYCFNFVRSGKDWWGVIIAIICAVLSVGLYFFFVAVFRALGKNGQLPVFLSAWVPNLIYCAIAGVAITHHCIRR